MSILPALSNQLDEIGQILGVLREMERRQRDNRRSFYEKSRMIAASKAAIYIMFYNTIEAAMRALLLELRSKMQLEEVLFYQATEFWRLDAIQARFLHRMTSGTNHGNLLGELVPMTSAAISWSQEDLDRLPFSGNFGQSAALKLSSDLGLDWKPPKGTLGGNDLENIRERRNALAHGLETFYEAGSQVTASGLSDSLSRVRTFMSSYVAAIETYSHQRGYIT